jgi:DNA-binding CsgD family transcriptional regulator/tetratricopeptide (TPR) repeat protein
MLAVARQHPQASGHRTIRGMDLLERADSLGLLRGCPPGRVMLVAGEAGIGKTSLVREFCSGDARPVLWGACDALRTPRPLGPLRDIAGQAGAELARLFAEDEPRYAIFGAFLAELAARDTIAVMEDVHWADEATLDLLIFTARRIAATASVLIVTYREDQVSGGHPLLAMLGALATDRSVRRVRLRPLSAAAVGALAAPRGLDAATLHALTGGNPFFVTEVLAEPGRTVPRTVRDAVLAGAAALSAAERDVLGSVAIFPGGTLLPMVQGEPAAIDGCVAAGVLTMDGRHIGFRHELARLAVEESIPPARKAALHALALAGLSRQDTDPAQLAFHAEEAGDGVAVLRHAPEAARRASTVGARRQAADHYAQALRFAAGLPAAERGELLEAYSEACAGVNRGGTAIAASSEALDCWRQAGDEEREVALLARRSHYLWSNGENAAAREATQAALALAERLPPGRGLAAAYTWSAYLLMLAHEMPAAIDAGRRAITLAEQLGEGSLLSRALNAVGTAYWFRDPDVAEQMLARSLAVARQAGDDAAVASALVNLGSGVGEIRRYEAAERSLREAIAWCTARDLEGSRRFAAAWLARCLFERGEWHLAADMLDQATPDSPVEPAVPSTIVALTVLGRLRTRRGDPGAAEALDRAWILATATGDFQHLWPVAAGKAELAWLQGRPAGDLVAETYQLAVKIGHGWAIGELGQWLQRLPDQYRAPAHEAAAFPYQMEPVRAARAWEELGCPYEAAMALADSPDQLPESLRRLERLGARPAADWAARQLRNRGIRTARRTTLAHPDGLTARESDVLDLLREELSNAQIAARLHISPKTVDHHVSAILAKLGVRTRHDAARHGELAEPE